MVSGISGGLGGAMSDLIGMAQNTMSLLQSQRESRRVNAGGIVCETTADSKYMLGTLAGKRGISMLSNVAEKTTLAASETALEGNKKYIEEKAREAFASTAEGAITDRLLEEKATTEGGQPENPGSDQAALPDVDVSLVPASAVTASQAVESSVAMDTSRQSVDITV